MKWKSSGRALSGVFVALVALCAFAVMPATAAVTPAAVVASLEPGGSVGVDKLVDTPAIPPNPDIVFLADTTGSMGSTLANVQANATAIMNAVLAEQPTAQFGVSAYRDVGDAFLFQLNQSITADVAAAQAGINSWAAGGGGDTPEGQIPALYTLATDPAVGFRSDSTRVVVWFGDASGHDPRNGISLTDAITALQAAGISVIAIPVDSGSGDGLDASGQATAIATATDGSVQPGATPDQVSAAILNGLSNLPITVTPVPVGCEPLDISFNPPSDTVTSGEQATFVETIALPNDTALAGTSVDCVVDFRDGNDNVIGSQTVSITVPISIDAEPEVETNELGTAGQTHTVTATVTSGDVLVAGATVEFEILTGPNAGETASVATDGSGDASFTYEATQGAAGLGLDEIEACTTSAGDVTVCDTVTKEWVDTTPPVIACAESTNPSGKNVPPAKGQNPDGFYLLTASDAVTGDVDIEIDVNGLLRPDGSPFRSGDTIKYTQDDDAVASSVVMGGPNSAIAAHIVSPGDAVITATDGSGNTASVTCLVPRPPR